MNDTIPTYKNLAAATAAARSALTRGNTAAWSLALTLSAVSRDGLAPEVDDLRNGETAFSRWYSTSLIDPATDQPISTHRVSALMSWVEVTSILGKSITISNAKALAPIMAAHGKTREQNVRMVHSDATTAAKAAGKSITQRGIMSQREKAKLLPPASPAAKSKGKSKSESKTESKTESAPAVSTVAAALAALTPALAADREWLPASKSERESIERLAAELIRRAAKSKSKSKSRN